MPAHGGDIVMDHDMVEAIGLSLCPEQPLELTQCWVAILNEVITKYDEIEKTSFTWYRVKRSHSVGKMLGNYTSITQAQNSDTRPMVLKRGIQTLASDLMIGDLVEAGDTFIALQVSRERERNSSCKILKSLDPNLPVRSPSRSSLEKPTCTSESKVRESTSMSLGLASEHTFSSAAALAPPQAMTSQPGQTQSFPSTSATDKGTSQMTSRDIHSLIDQNPEPTPQIWQRILEANNQFVALGGREFQLAEKVGQLRTPSSEEQPMENSTFSFSLVPAASNTARRVIPTVNSPNRESFRSLPLTSARSDLSVLRANAYGQDALESRSELQPLPDVPISMIQKEVLNLTGEKFIRHVQLNREEGKIFVACEFSGGNMDQAACDSLLKLIANPNFDNVSASWYRHPRHGHINKETMHRANRHGINATQIANYIVSRCALDATGDKWQAHYSLRGWQLDNVTKPYAPATTPKIEQADVSLPARSLCSPSPEAVSQHPNSDSPGKSSPKLSEEPPSSFSERTVEFSIKTPTSESIETQLQSAKKNFQLQSMMNGKPLEILEEAVRTGTQLLDALTKPLVHKAAMVVDAVQWIEQIEKVKRQIVRTKTIVGVVGNTGAGKSSVINALLDEERLVPTNCMRACTAVITEISYNDEVTPYRAEIEFIERADWERELRILFQDLLGEGGQIARDATSNEDSEAGVAYAKIRAVYPDMVREQIENSSIEVLMNHSNVSVLGKSRRINENNSLVFYRKLQAIIDSKEKSDKKKKERRPKGVPPPPKEPAYWPLIKVVRLYIKAPALSTGAVVVDLPGVHDSNAARAKVAENYMKQCTGLWIVAPINRAVDDKAAKSLLGESFKRQLKMDACFSTVTFICSKTDDISIMEAQDSLGLEQDFEDFELQCQDYRKETKRIKAEIEDIKSAKKDIDAAVENAINDLEIWEALKDDAEGGKTVFPLRAPTGGKRKRGSQKTPKKCKKRRIQGSESDSEGSASDFVDDNEEEDASDSESVDNNNFEGAPLSLEDINAKLAELKVTRRNARQQKSTIDEQMKPLSVELAEIEKRIDAIEVEERAICIAGRNEYSKGAIQQDFAAGIKELDQEIAEEEDAANFNPELDVRDYDEVARSLPVFCVSARAYQRLMGRLRQESDVPGFKSIQDTEMPQLQEHCKRLTVAGRTNACNQFLATLSQLLNSLALWAANDGTGANQTLEQKTREDRLLQQQLKSLESDLDKLVANTCKDLQSEFQDQIYDKFDTAVQSATEEAIPAVLQWGSPINRENRAQGGYYWSTYKAICRRNGVFTNGQGPHEWNAKLAEPIIRNVAPGWERTFSRRILTVLNDFAKRGQEILKKFHDTVASRAQSMGSNTSGLYLLGQQLAVYRQMLTQISEAIKGNLTTQQRDINRQFTPSIEQTMAYAYERCSSETGPGQYMRMKALMNSHVNDKRHTMFQDSTNTVKDLLKNLVKDVRKTVDGKVDEIYMSMRRDYLSALGGGEAKFGQVMPKAQRTLRKKVSKVIDRAECLFEKTINPGGTDGDDQFMVDNSDIESEEEEMEHIEVDNAGITRLASKISDHTTSLSASSLPTPINGLTHKLEPDIKNEPVDYVDGIPATTGTRPYPKMPISQSQAHFPATQTSHPYSQIPRPNSTTPGAFVRPDMSALTGNQGSVSRSSGGRLTSAPCKTQPSINPGSSAPTSPPLRAHDAGRETSPTTSDDRSDNVDATPDASASESEHTDYAHAFSEVDSDEGDSSAVLSESGSESDVEVKTPASNDSDN